MDLGFFKGLIERANRAMGKDTCEEEAKVLNTKDRKKLRSSVFCCPGRSYPTPDCRHIAVAKAYLARGKFSESTKKKIAACINRCAKLLKCNVSKKAKAYIEYSYESLTEEQRALYDSEIFDTTRALVEESETNPGMELAFEKGCCN